MDTSVLWCFTSTLLLPTGLRSVGVGACIDPCIGQACTCQPCSRHSPELHHISQDPLFLLLTCSSCSIYPCNLFPHTSWVVKAFQTYTCQRARKRYKNFIFSLLVFLLLCQRDFLQLYLYKIWLCKQKSSYQVYI